MSDSREEFQERGKQKQNKKVYSKGDFGEKIRKYLRANGEEKILDETVDLIEQYLVEFIVQLTTQIHLDNPTKAIKPEDVLIHLITDRKKFDRGSYMLYQNFANDQIKKRVPDVDLTAMAFMK